ncbi:MAG: nitroreductase family protein [Thermodesulfobacteriota bacterium]
MKDFLESIKERRSVRKYEEKEIPEEMLNQVLESVRWSPSWANTQCWEIVVVKDPVIKERLQATLPEKGNPARTAMIQAPAVLALCGKLKSSGYYKDQAATRLGDWFMFDLGIAAQTLCLYAGYLGLGTVIVGLFDHDRAKEVLKVPAGYELTAMIPIGYPAKKTEAPKRKELREFIHKDTF